MHSGSAASLLSTQATSVDDHAAAGRDGSCLVKDHLVKDGLVNVIIRESAVVEMRDHLCYEQGDRYEPIRFHIPSLPALPSAVLVHWSLARKAGKCVHRNQGTYQCIA
jgi:hypothetical protein